MAGRRPKPTAAKKLEGNHGKRKLNMKEPVLAKGMHACPDWLMPEAKKEWGRLAELVNQIGVLTVKQNLCSADCGKTRQT